MKKAKYICFEGTEGTGKTTQLTLVADLLRSQGYKVLETKEPGTSNSPLTMEIRKLILDPKHDKDMTISAREFMLQAIRSIHIEKVVNPAKEDYDYIIQDRGQLSGLAYGHAIGVPDKDMDKMIDITLDGAEMASLYDMVIIFRGDVRKGLQRAVESKQEFEGGDALENKGNTFIEKVGTQVYVQAKKFNNVKIIDIDGKDIPTVSKELLSLIYSL